MDPIKDLFISHASEDKASLVRPLANLLRRLGCSVWYDEFELRPGDSLTESIDRGIVTSSFGLIVLSKAFFAKHWTKEELRGLRAMEAGKLATIVPVWLGVTLDDVRAFSPTLADKFAINATSQTIQQISLEILKVVKPKLLEFMHLNSLILSGIAKSQVADIDPKKLKPSPVRHQFLGVQVLSRLRLLHACLHSADGVGLETWIDNFSRDQHPHHELMWWEYFCASYVQLCEILEGRASKKDVFRNLFDVLNSEHILTADRFITRGMPVKLEKRVRRFVDAFVAEHDLLFDRDEILHSSFHPKPEDW